MSHAIKQFQPMTTLAEREIEGLFWKLRVHVSHLERKAGSVLTGQLPAAVEVARGHRAGFVREVDVPDGTERREEGRGGVRRVSQL